MPSDSLIEAAERVLAGKRCQLWANFNISTPEDRRKAAVEYAGWVEDLLIEKASPTRSWHDLGLVG